MTADNNDKMTNDTESVAINTKEPVDPTPKPTALIKQYLQQNLGIYEELAKLQKHVWDSKEADAFFGNLQQNADKANSTARRGFFKLMMNIAHQLDDATSALTIPLTWGKPAILDLCMAPGGFSKAALNLNKTALLRGISLPEDKGGHEILINNWKTDARIQIDFRDITMLAAEMGIPSIPSDHPDAASFSPYRPFLDTKFDLVLCDGQVLRTHARASYREHCEAGRLLTSQLVLALQRVRPGGAVVILLHRVDSWRSATLLHRFAGFAEIELFKPRHGHAMRTSFYLVAKNVRPESEAAREAVGAWKEQWRTSTFGNGEEHDGEGEVEAPDTASDETVSKVLEEFGQRLVEMAEPLFEIQIEALRSAPFMREILDNTDGGNGEGRNGDGEN